MFVIMIHLFNIDAYKNDKTLEPIFRQYYC